jgi:tripeptide aminopeptidase
MNKIVERFMTYVRFETTSDSESSACPSTSGQHEFGDYLVRELKQIGLTDVNKDEHGYIMATLPANSEKAVPTLGFIAHLDTSADMSGRNVNPQIVRNYAGGDIILNKAEHIVLSPKECPELKQYIGEDLITTDGTTLLGADNKAGICEIVTAMEYLIRNAHIKHGAVKIAFTPDEEIGRGADLFDVDKFGCDFAYTIDGGEVGELEYENFNAAEAKITIKGRNVHPGTAKNKMINSLLIAMELNGMLPLGEIPGRTEGYEGFYHLTKFGGDVEQTNMTYIIRDHDRECFERRKSLLSKIVAFLQEKYGQKNLHLQLKDQYYNMKEKIEPVMHIISLAKNAIQEAGVQPKVKPIRGGTDGARLSYMGLPCPNIFTGGHNFHGRYEFIPVSSMHRAVDVIVKIVERAGEIEMN